MTVGWSRVVDSPAHAREVLADPGDALDLRAAAAPSAAWAELGFTELVPGELVRPLEVHLADAAATRALGTRLAAALRPGDLVVLSGPLGAGKTALTQGIGTALGVRGAVTSPTFVLARVHRGPLPLVHVDAYRLRDAAAGGELHLDDLDLEAELSRSVTVVEWGEGVVEGVAADRLHVTLSRPALHRPHLSDSTTQTGADHRTARVSAVGGRWSVVQPP